MLKTVPQCTTIKKDIYMAGNVGGIMCWRHLMNID